MHNLKIKTKYQKLILSGMSLPIAMMFTLGGSGILYAFYNQLYSRNWNVNYKIAKYNANGELINSFGTNGVLTIPNGNFAKMLVLADNSLLFLKLTANDKIGFFHYFEWYCLLGHNARPNCLLVQIVPLVLLGTGEATQSLAII